MTTTVDPSRLAKLVDLRIDASSHTTFEEGHCAMELVAWLAHEEHSDHPACTCTVIAAFVRRWNDGIRDTERRTNLLRPLLPELVGTRGSRELSIRRGYAAADWSVRTLTPMWLRCAGLEEEAASLEKLAELVDENSAREARRRVSEVREIARKKSDAAYAAADAADAAAAAAAAAAYAAADAADAADAAYAAAAAAYAAAYAAAAAAYAAAAAAYAARASRRKRLLAMRDQADASAQDLVRRLIAMRDPA